MLEAMARGLRNAVPDALIIAIALTWVVGLAGVLSGVSPSILVKAWVEGHSTGSGRPLGGLWSLHTFSMQMCLILVTGTILAGAPPIREGLRALAARVHRPRQAVALVALVAASLALVNWGLGLIAGAVLAREVAASCRARGIGVPPPLLAAAGYLGMAVWHGGLSGSAPLKVTADAGLAEVLGAELAAQVGAIPLSMTTFSLRNLVVTALAVSVGVVVLVLLTPRQAPTDAGLVAPPAPEPPPAEPSIAGLAGFLEQTPIVPWSLAALLGAWLIPWAWGGGWRSLDPDGLNLIFLATGLLLVGSTRRLVTLATEGATASAGILLQFPLYGGILGLLAAGGWMRWLAEALPGSEAALALATFLSAGAVNILIPSGGGQWAVQGPIVMEAAVRSGADPARVVLALVYGDQWTNLIQPFWALPLLGITGVRLSEILAPCAVVAAALGVVFGVGIWLG